LSATTRPDDLYYDSGVTDINERWGTSQPAFPVDETIRRIETAGAWIVIKRAEEMDFPLLPPLTRYFPDRHKLSLHRAEAWPQAQDSDIAGAA
jgi:hypothetical protein